MIDPTLPFQLTTKAPIVDNGNCWSPGVYRPGELPSKFLIPTYGHNIGNAPPVSAVIGEATVSIPLQFEESKDEGAKIVPNIDWVTININTSNVEELKIDGLINTNIASKIVTEREKNGDYADFKNLLDRIPTLAAKATSLEERFSFETN